MRNSQPRYSPLRRLLFPYNGREPLSRAQGTRLIVTWALFFASTLTLCSFPVTLVGTASWQKIVVVLLAAFFLEVAVFGTLAFVVVVMNNRAARFLQQRRKATETNSTSGGRYGS